MSQKYLTVRVICRFKLDQAGLEALIARLPGLTIHPFDTIEPPQVLVYDYGNSDSIDLPERSPQTALLLLVPGDEPPDLLPEASRGVLGLF